MKKSLEIQVEEKEVAETKNKVQTMMNSLEVTKSSIKQTQMTSVNGYRGDECQNHAYAETKSSESKRTWRLVRNLKYLWVRCETELGIFSQELKVFVVSLLFQCSSCDYVWSVACGLTALEGLSARL